jgi:hypothetical protein
VPQQAWPSAPHVEHLPPLQVPAGAAVLPQVAPSATQVPEKQHAPCPQPPSAQQGAPGAPHATQVEVAEQTSPGWRHVAAVVPTAGQHASPAFCPQEEQALLTQRVPADVHNEAVAPALGLQQGRPMPPQPPQAPFAQTPGNGAQLAPLAAHCPDTQQPPPAQTLPPQQGWPGMPQGGPIVLSAPPPLSRGPLPSLATGWSCGASSGPSSPWGTSGEASLSF